MKTIWFEKNQNFYLIIINFKILQKLKLSFVGGFTDIAAEVF